MQIIRAFLEILAEVGLLLLQPFGALLGRLFPNRLLEQQPDVIIVFRWLTKNPLHYLWKRYLEKQGLQVSFLYYPLYKGTFRKSALDLKKYIDKHNTKKITLVGISSGGITCYSYLQEYEGWQNVKQFISVGTPFYGSPPAYLLSFLPYMQAVTPHNVFLNDLTKESVKHPDKITCIAAQIDELVPRTSSHISGAKLQVMPVLGHNNLHTTYHKTYAFIAKVAKT